MKCCTSVAVYPTTDAPNGSIVDEFFETPIDHRLLHYYSTTASSDKSRRLVLFIHGVGSCSRIWLPYVKQIALPDSSPQNNRIIRVIAVDLFGHGKSSLTLEQSDFLFPQLCRDVVSLFDKEIETCDGAFLIGHSYGCSIALAIASERHSKIAGLCLISPSAPLPLKPRDAILKIPNCLFECLFPCMRLSFFRSAYHKAYCCAPNSDDVAFNVSPKVLKLTMLGQIWPEGNLSFYESLRAKIPKIMVIHGASDRLVPKGEAALTSQCLSAKFFIVENAGHMVPLEAMETVNELIQEFLSAAL